MDRAVLALRNADISISLFLENGVGEHNQCGDFWLEYLSLVMSEYFLGMLNGAFCCRPDANRLKYRQYNIKTIL